MMGKIEWFVAIAIFAAMTLFVVWFIDGWRECNKKGGVWVGQAHLCLKTDAVLK